MHYIVYLICLNYLFTKWEIKKIYLESYSSEQKSDYTIKCENLGKEIDPIIQIEAISPDILIIYINKLINHKYYDNIINFPMN